MFFEGRRSHGRRGSPPGMSPPRPRNKTPSDLGVQKHESQHPDRDDPRDAPHGSPATGRGGRESLVRSPAEAAGRRHDCGRWWWAAASASGCAGDVCTDWASDATASATNPLHHVHEASRHSDDERGRWASASARRGACPRACRSLLCRICPHCPLCTDGEPHHQSSRRGTPSSSWRLCGSATAG